MSAKILARFADGRLLVQESRLCPQEATSTGQMPFRVGYVKTVEEVLSIGLSSGYSWVRADVSEVQTSGDTVIAVLRKFASGYATQGAFVTSGVPILSGKATITANVIGLA